MELDVIYRSVAALDVHQVKLTVCVLFETDTGEVVSQIREFGGFKRDRREMATWVSSFNPELVVMESTGIYWKSPYSALEKHGLKLAVVMLTSLNKSLVEKQILLMRNGWPFWRFVQTIYTPPNPAPKLLVLVRDRPIPRCCIEATYYLAGIIQLSRRSNARIIIILSVCLE